MFGLLICYLDFKIIDAEQDKKMQRARRAFPQLQDPDNVQT
jgi:hypothetical protein